MNCHHPLEVNLKHTMCKSLTAVAIRSNWIRTLNWIPFSSRFEHTWPAMSYKLNGTIFVYNPEDKKHAEELNLWYNNFVEKPNLTEKCCLLVASKRKDDEEGGGRRGHEAKLCTYELLYLHSIRISFFSATLFSDIPRVTFNGTTDEIETIKQKFGDFLRKVVTEASSRGHDQDDRYS